MTEIAPVTIRRVAVGMLLAAALPGLAACGGGGSASAPTSAVPPPAPPPAPPPPPPTAYRATVAPFGLTQSRDLDVFGWDQWPATPVVSTMKLRWNASTSEYEVQPAGATEFARLRALANSTFSYDVFSMAGALLPYTMVLEAPPTLKGLNFVGEARIFDNPSVRNFVAFGLATASADLPVSGQKTCDFSLDEIGDGHLIVDFGANTATGYVEPFWSTQGGAPPQYAFAATLSRSDEATVSATYGTAGTDVVEMRFFGPQAAEVGVRSKGKVTGVMIGTCKP